MTKITTKSAKAKGRRFQQWIAQKIAYVTGCTYGKDQEIESREMGQSGVDVKLYGRARMLFNFAVEAKAQEKWSIHEWIKQAKANGKSYGAPWLLFCKRNRENPVVVMDAEYFFEMIGELIDDKGFGKED